MELIQAVNKKRLEQMEQLYLRSFPKNERKPFSLIVNVREKGLGDMWSLEEDGESVGLAITVNYEDRVLLDYFAIEEEKQGMGYGSAAIQTLLTHYQRKRLLIEIESTKDQAENSKERIRRKEFYHRNGFTDLDFMVELFGVRMEMLSNQRNVTFEEYLEVYIRAFGDRMKEFVKRTLPVNINV